jgi:hypothetical protein
MEGKGIGLNAVALEHLGDDLRHVHALKNPLVVAELQIVQRRYQGQVIASQAFARLAHQHIFDMPMYAFAIKAELRNAGWPSKLSRSKSGYSLTSSMWRL